MDNFRKPKGILLIIILIIAGTVLVACLGSAATPLPAPSPVPTLDHTQILVLGDISEDPAKTIEEFQPMADYLAANLTEFGIQQGKVVVAQDMNGMIDYLKKGDVDLYFDSPFPALTIHEEAGAVPLLRRWKGGVGEYHSLIVVREDSGISTLDDLQGKVLAFEDPASTSAYLLPKAHLVSLGYDVVEVANATNLANDRIGYVFAASEENILAWTLEEKTAGGVISSGSYEDLSDEDRGQLFVLAKTQAVPRHIVLASPTTDEALRQRISEILLELDSTPEGQEILQSFEETSQFDPIPGGTDTAFESLQNLFAPVR